MKSIFLILSLFLLATMGYSNELPTLKILAMEQLSKGIDVLPTSALRNLEYSRIKNAAGSIIDDKEHCYKNFEDYYFKTRRWNYVWLTSQSTACDVEFVQLNTNEDRIIIGHAKTVNVWDLQGNLQVTLDYTIPITALDVNDDGNTIVTGHANGYVGYATLKKSDDEAGIVLDRFFTSEQSQSPVIAVKYLEGLQKILSACKAGSVRMWNNQMEPSSTLDKVIPDIQTIIHNQYGTYVNTQSNDVYKLSSNGQLLEALLMPLKASGLGINNNKLVSVCPSHMTLFDVKKNKQICSSLTQNQKIKFNSSSNVAVSHDKATVLFGSEAEGIPCLNIITLYGNRMYVNGFRKLKFPPLPLYEDIVLKKQIKKVALGKNLLIVLFENKIENDTVFYNSFRTVEVYKPFSLEQILNYTKLQQ